MIREPRHLIIRVEHAEEFYKKAYHAANPFDVYDDFRDEACKF